MVGGPRTAGHRIHGLGSPEEKGLEQRPASLSTPHTSSAESGFEPSGCC